ncbi:hypothetical protein AVEN_154816-1 [Araneus ventricosus]|uniref:C2H2-type domain-containing protein n=1 Tax=Araneus ventricosus TaxID=182803 RepID=A0A4Y2BUK1_ARAVE|nr:hypothetical protein AVEN_154816-1 [Araneus ventricosus]
MTVSNGRFLSALHPADSHADQKVRYEPFADSLNFSGMVFPLPLKDIPKFEKKNNLSINVYGLTDDNVVFPLLISKETKRQHINLLYIKKMENSHYCCIKSLSRLVSSQLSKHNNKKFICPRCLQYFSSEVKLNCHSEVCQEHEPVHVHMPDDKWLQFKNVRRSFKLPFVVYADFECLCLPVSSCEPTSSSAYTERYQKHEPISFCYYIAYAHGFYKEPVTYRGPNASKHFMMLLKQEAEEIFQIYQNPKEMIE